MPVRLNSQYLFYNPTSGEPYVTISGTTAVSSRVVPVRKAVTPTIGNETKEFAPDSEAAISNLGTTLKVRVTAMTAITAGATITVNTSNAITGTDTVAATMAGIAKGANLSSGTAIDSIPIGAVAKGYVTTFDVPRSAKDYIQFSVAGTGSTSAGKLLVEFIPAEK